MFPNYRTKAASDPMGQGTKAVERLGFTVIIPPASDIIHQLANQIANTAATAAGRYLFDPLSKPLYALPVDAYLGIRL